MKLKYYLRGLGAGIVLSTLVLSFVLNQNVTVEKLTDDEIIERAEALGMTQKNSNVNIDYDAINESIKGTENSGNTNSKNENLVETSDQEKKEEQKVDANQDDTQIQQEDKNQSTEDKDQEKVEQASGDKKNDDNAKQEDTKDLDKAEGATNQQDNQEVSNNQESNQTEKEDSTDPKEDEKDDSDEESLVTKTVTIRPGMTAKEVSEMLEKAGVISSAEAFNIYLIERGLTEKILSKKMEIAVNTDFAKIAKLITER